MAELNEYFREALIFLRGARRQRTMAHEHVLLAALLYAVGLERLLKGLLYDINPLYVYKDPAFKNTVTALYASRVLENSTKSQELAASPNHDVITFREALRRAAVFSKAVQNDSAQLHRIATYRDVIAHCPLRELDNTVLLHIAYVDAPKIVTAFEAELGLEVGTLHGRPEEDPEEIEARNRAKELLAARISEHRHRWGTLSTDEVHRTQAQRKLDILENLSRSGDFNVPFTCPACANPGAITAEVDYDHDHHEGISIPQGAFPVRFECTFCDLVITDSFELDEIEASQHMYDLSREWNERGRAG